MVRFEELLKPKVIKPARKSFHNLIGQTQKMQEIYEVIESVACSSATVLIYGESGTGKRLVAQGLHASDSLRRNQPFIEISCGALPETLLESELFGHIRGSFTGAFKDRQGRFELANNGAIFLDEIDTCSFNLQVKLLRVLEDGTFERVGDHRTSKTNARIIAASNRNLEELVKKNDFREDLYWRLNVIKIELPPLRERKEDIPLLVEHFLDRYNRKMIAYGKSNTVKTISKEALAAMQEYHWPGNIRQLQNVIERVCILAKGNELCFGDLPDIINQDLQKADNRVQKCAISLKDYLKNPEKDIIKEVLQALDWNCSRAAVRLGINRATLYKKMRLYGLERNKVIQ